MLLALLLAVGAQDPAPRPQTGLSTYAIVAAEYRRGDRERALREIRQWGPSELGPSIRELRAEGVRLHFVVLQPGEEIQAPVAIDVRTAEAAALMHVEAGLLEIQSLGVARAMSQFAAATNLAEWLHGQKAWRLRWLARLRRYHVPDGKPDRDLPIELERVLSIELKLDTRELYVAIVAGTLALAFPEAALRFAETAKRLAPRDSEVLLLSACVKESLALEAKAKTREGDARRLRVEAEALFRKTLAADPAQVEARLRLGGVLLAESRATEAEPELQAAAEQARDKRQLYLALLFLGRASEAQEKPNDGAAFYRRALEAWPESQAARLGLARCLEASAGPSAAHALVMQSLDDSRKDARERDPWWSYPFGPRDLAKTVLERLWQRTLGRSFGS